MKSLKLTFSVFAILMIFISSCNNQTLKIFQSNSARAQYQNTLKNSGIATTKIGLEWQSSADDAILTASELEVPVAIQGSFLSKSVEARAWSIQLDQGASVNIIVNWQASDSSKLIVDLLTGSDLKEIESYTAKNDPLKFEADKTGQYLLRIQPELLGEGNFQVRITGTATYAVFPVEGKNSAAIQSVWGDVRDGGERSHEGVDIFASRGTTVLAPVEGVVTAVRDRGLGGKQVWVRDTKRGWNLYFAHLDSQLVSNLQRVSPGDTLGLVGNTGNARSTAPHLHFGIYQSGAINPFPAIETEFDAAPELEVQQLATIMRVNTANSNIRSQPTTKSEVISKLEVNTPVFILAATLDWFQVKTVEGVNGFLYRNLLSAVDSIALEEKETYAFTQANSTSDSLSVDLAHFSSIGYSGNGRKLIIDKDGNLLYLTSAD
ncbi:M23 family metallopeptidase [Algoriphagus sp.]|uniref:M23 family metallopeptidase n=2 Tax=Algoriphagus sp. TaxID=1872435 RepID=UPI00329A5C20